MLIIALAVFAITPLRKVFFREPLLSKATLPRERIDYFDFLKGVAIISVIIIHVAYFFQHLNPYNNDFFINTVTNLLRFAIPFFFICSGMLLASFDSHKMKLGKYYYNKFIRIIIPYLIMNVLFAAYLQPSMEEFVVNVIGGAVIPPYYFTVVLVIFYLIFPLIRRFKDSKIFLLASFFISFISFFLPQLLMYGALLFTTNLFFFFVYGMYMRNYFLPCTRPAIKKEAILWWVIILLYLWIVLGFSGFYYNNQFFYGIAVFNLFFIFKDKIIQIPKVFFRALCSFGRASLWIFLTHFPIVFLIYSILSFGNFNYYVFYALTGVFSIVICYLAGKISLLAYNGVLKVLYIKVS
mgnify:FL=1